MSSNPYFFGPPASGETGFYDREDIFRFVNRTLAAPRQNVIVLYGQRRIGKTSILHQIPRRLQDPDRYHAVFVDLQDMLSSRTASTMLYSLAYEICRSLGYSLPERSAFDGLPEAFADDFLPGVYNRLGRKRLLLTVDEIDVLAEAKTQANRAEHPFVRQLDRIIQGKQHQGRIVFVFAIGRTVRDVGSLSRVFRGASTRQIAFLSSEDAVRLIVEPAQGVLAFADDAVEKILSLTGCHPYYVQLLCHHAFSRVLGQNRDRVTAQDVVDVVDEALGSAVNASSWFWADMPAVERFVIWAVSNPSNLGQGASLDDIRAARDLGRIPISDVELDNIPTSLIARQILVRDEAGSYRFAVELVRRWISRAHTLEEIAQDPYFVNEQAQSFFRVGRAAEQEGKLDEAIANYQRARNAAPNYQDAYLRLGQALLKRRDLEEAIAEYENARRFGGVDARQGLIDARLQYGHQLETGRQVRDAIREYERVLEIDSTHREARQRLSRLHLARAHDLLAVEGPDQARPEYERALGHWPATKVEVRSQLEAYKTAREQEARWPEAERAMQVAVALMPGDAGLHQTLIKTRLAQCDVWLSQHKVEAAQETSQRALDDCLPELEAELVFQIRDTLSGYRSHREEEGEWQRAEAAMEALAALLSGDPQSHLELAETRIRWAQAYLNDDDIEGALQADQRALAGQLDADGRCQVVDEAKRQFSRYCQQREAAGDWERAEGAMRALVTLLPADREAYDWLAHTLATQGEAYLDIGKPLEAEAAYVKAEKIRLALQEPVAPLLLKQAQARLEMHALESAHSACQLALKEPSSDLDVAAQTRRLFTTYRHIREGEEQWARAEEAMSALVALLPNDPGPKHELAETRLNQARFYLHRDQINRAQGACQRALEGLPGASEWVARFKEVFDQYCIERERTGAWDVAERARQALLKLLPGDVQVAQALSGTRLRQSHAHLSSHNVQAAAGACWRALAGLAGFAQQREELVVRIKAQFDLYRREQQRVNKWALAQSSAQALADLLPEDEEARRWLADALIERANFYLSEEDVEQAAAACWLALDCSPDLEEASRRIKETFRHYCHRRENDAAWKQAERAMAALVRLFPADASVQSDSAELLERQDDAYLAEKRLPKAQQAYGSAIDIWQSLCRALPDENAPRERLARAWVKRGRVCLASGDIPAAQEACQWALTEWPDDLHILQEVLDLFIQYGERQVSNGNWAEAERALHALVSLQPQSRTVRRQLANLRVRWGDARCEEGQYEEAVSSYQCALDDYRYLSQASANDPTLRDDLVKVWEKLGQVHQRLGQHDLAYQAFTRAIELMEGS